MPFPDIFERSRMMKLQNIIDEQMECIFLNRKKKKKKGSFRWVVQAKFL